MIDIAPYALAIERRSAQSKAILPLQSCVSILTHVPFVTLLVALVTFALRALYLDRAYDIFIDEITYLHIARSIANNLEVKLYGETFYLHPPAFFYIEAAYLKLFQVSGSIIEQIYATRYLNATFAGLSAVALYHMGRRLAGNSAGLIAAAIFALDPFIIKMNSYNLLDTSAIWWVLAGYLLLFATLRDDPTESPLWIHLAALRAKVFSRSDANVAPLVQPALGPSRVTLWRLCAAGFSFGLALLTKDMTAFLTLLPMLLCFLLNWSIRRWATVIISMVTVLTYSIYPITVALVGEWHHFEDQKLRGVQRLLGVAKITGVNREGGPSLVEVILARLEQFGSTYMLLGFGAIAVVFLLLYGRTMGRFLAVWTASAYALLTYAALFGTLEEQFFYFLVPPALLSFVVAIFMIWQMGSVSGWLHRSLLSAAILLAVIFTGWSTYQWVQVHTIPDNGYEQILAYLQAHTPPQTKVAATSETAQFLLDDYGSGPWGSWNSPDELLRYSPDYVLVSESSLKWNFGDDANQLLEWLDEHGEPVYHFVGRGSNRLTLYDLR